MVFLQGPFWSELIFWEFLDIYALGYALAETIFSSLATKADATRAATTSPLMQQWLAQVKFLKSQRGTQCTVENDPSAVFRAIVSFRTRHECLIKILNIQLCRDSILSIQ